MTLKIQIQELSVLLNSLISARSLAEKKEFLCAFPLVKEKLKDPFFASQLPSELKAQVVFLSVLAIGQGDILFASKSSKRSKLLKNLIEIDRFYDSLGGIVGYHLKAIRLINEEPLELRDMRFSRAEGLNVSEKSSEVQQAILKGIESLAYIGEVYPIGGLGTRLNLKTSKGDPLPVACLNYCGRSLLEGLVRDVQAREYLYYKLFDKQITIPIAMMTSQEKKNHFYINKTCREAQWFKRPKESFFLFSQLSVPVLTEEGEWSLLAPDELNLHPGGHGALWRMAEERGVFKWLFEQGKEALLIRQINNPIAGTDHGLLSLVGWGRKEKKAFGFASCERLPAAAEGMLVQVEKADQQRTISNIEYTHFSSFGVEDKPTETGYSLFPANTNILYADLKQLMPVFKMNPLPGLMLNMKASVPSHLPNGEVKVRRGGRLESMMQNIADALLDPPGQPLRTFLTYNKRRKTISTTKCSFEAGKKLQETPEGAFYDMMFNGYELLQNYCGFTLPSFSSEEEFLKEGPSLLFLYHPALGPLYEVIAQKIRGGKIAEKSEWQIECATVDVENLSLEGSLLIQTDAVLGSVEKGILKYNSLEGKCSLKGVSIRNAGLDRSSFQSYWKGNLKRKESVQILLQGNAEFHAEDVCIEKGQRFSVPKGERWILCKGIGGEQKLFKETISQPTWDWDYSLKEGSIKLQKRHSRDLCVV